MNNLLSEYETDAIFTEQESVDFNALFEFSKLLNSSLDLKFILDHILLSSMGKMMITRGCVFLNIRDDQFRMEASKGISKDMYVEKIKLNNLPDTIFFMEELDHKKNRWYKILNDLNLKIGVPVLIKEEVLAVIFFGEKTAKQPFNNKDLFFLRILSNISSTSIENGLIVQELKMVNRDLDKKIQQLNSLFDLGKEFSGLFDNEKIIKLLSFSIMGQMGLQKFVILLKENDSLKIVASRIPGLDSNIDKLDILKTIDKPGPLGSYKSKYLKESLGLLRENNIQVLVPMQINRQNCGLIMLGEKLSKEEYSPTDIEFIYSLGNLAIFSMENARLFKETLEKQKMEEEIQIAKEIQLGLLPKHIPEIKGFEVATFNSPSRQVGGDYFDIIKISEELISFAIADVSGKGIPASLLMSNLQALFHAYAPMSLSLSEITGKINDIVFGNTDASKFITFFWGVLNANEKSFTYVNAGHNPAILLHSDGSINYFSKGGIILGVMQTLVPYEEEKILLQEDDLLFMYTDGVTESMDKHHQEFGEKKLIDALFSKYYESTSDIIQHVYEELKSHSEGLQQYDDITMIAIKVK